MDMWNFAELSEMEKRDTKSISEEQRRFVIAMEKAAGV